MAGPTLSQNIFDVGLTPHAEVECISGAAAASRILRLKFHIELGAYLIVASGGALIALGPIGVLYGIQVVAHGGSPTPITTSNVQTSTYIRSGWADVGPRGFTVGVQLSGQESYYISAHGEEDQALSQVMTANSDIYLCLAAPGETGWAGGGIAAVGTVYTSWWSST